MSDFDAWVEAHDPELVIDQAPEPIDPADVVRAERQLARLRRLAGERYEVGEVVQAKLSEVEAYRTDRLHGIEQAEQWLLSQLEAWHRARVAAGLVSGKSWVGVSGTLKLRAPGQPRLVVEDVDVESLQQTRPTWVREKLEVDKAAVKQATKAVDGKVIDTATGEVVEGLRYEQSTEDSFSWEVAP
jgi:hypothetical protein